MTPARIWPTLAGVTLVLGNAAAIWVLPGSAVLVCLAAGALVGCYLVAYRRARSREAGAAGTPPGTTAPASRPRVVALSAFTCVAGVGIIGLLGVAGVLCLLAVAVSSPVARSRLGVWFPRDQPPVGYRAGTGPESRRTTGMPALSSDPSRLTDTELCQIWSLTYLRLEDAVSVAARSEIIYLRTALLTELERRDPPGFARWMASGARAASNPSRYLSPAEARSRLDPPPT